MDTDPSGNGMMSWLVTKGIVGSAVATPTRATMGIDECIVDEFGGFFFSSQGEFKEVYRKMYLKDGRSKN